MPVSGTETHDLGGLERTRKQLQDLEVLLQQMLALPIMSDSEKPPRIETPIAKPSLAIAGPEPELSSEQTDEAASVTTSVSQIDTVAVPDETPKKLALEKNIALAKPTISYTTPDKPETTTEASDKPAIRMRTAEDPRKPSTKISVTAKTIRLARADSQKNMAVPDITARSASDGRNEEEHPPVACAPGCETMADPPPNEPAPQESLPVGNTVASSVPESLTKPSLLYRSLLVSNRIYDWTVGLFGKGAESFRGPRFKNLLGLTGIILLLCAAALAANTWFGWTW